MTLTRGGATFHQVSPGRPHVLRGGQWTENSHFAHTLAPVSSHWVFCGHTHRPSLGVFGAAPDLPEPPPPGGAGSAAKNQNCCEIKLARLPNRDMIEYEPSPIGVLGLKRKGEERG